MQHVPDQAATEAALGLPPLQRDAGLLRMCHVLAELCNLACEPSPLPCLLPCLLPCRCRTKMSRLLVEFWWHGNMDLETVA